jgi:hypothetical protein
LSRIRVRNACIAATVVASGVAFGLAVHKGGFGALKFAGAGVSHGACAACRGVESERLAHFRYSEYLTAKIWR